MNRLQVQKHFGHGSIFALQIYLPPRSHIAPATSGTGTITWL